MSILLGGARVVLVGPRAGARLGQRRARAHRGGRRRTASRAVGRRLRRPVAGAGLRRYARPRRRRSAFDSGDEARLNAAASSTAPTAPPRSSPAWSARRCDALERQVATLCDVRREGSSPESTSKVRGSVRRGAGAHDPGPLRSPTADDVQRLARQPAVGRCRHGHARSRAATAPIEAVRTLSDASVVAAIGAHRRNYAQTRAAIAAGARVATHLFNAMRPLHHREPGPFLALLEDERVTLEVIADGLHVDDALLRWLVATAGPERVALVTDAISAAAWVTARSRWATSQVDVRQGAARLAADPAALAGSTLTMAEAVPSRGEHLGPRCRGGRAHGESHTRAGARAHRRRHHPRRWPAPTWSCSTTRRTCGRRCGAASGQNTKYLDLCG